MNADLLVMPWRRGCGCAIRVIDVVARRLGLLCRHAAYALRLRVLIAVLEFVVLA